MLTGQKSIHLAPTSLCCILLLKRYVSFFICDAIIVNNKWASDSLTVFLFIKGARNTATLLIIQRSHFHTKLLCQVKQRAAKHEHQLLRLLELQV